MNQQSNRFKNKARRIPLAEKHPRRHHPGGTRGSGDTHAGPTYVPLPEGPKTASPVPWLTSILATPGRRHYGDPRYTAHDDPDPTTIGGESPFTFLVTVASYRVRGLTVGHYLTNPQSSPDSVLILMDVPRAADGTSLQEDFHRFVRVDRSILASWEGHDTAEPSRDVLIVSDELGTVILCDRFSESFAHALFDHVQLALGVGRFAD